MLAREDKHCLTDDGGHPDTLSHVEHLGEESYVSCEPTATILTIISRARLQICHKILSSPYPLYTTFQLLPILGEVLCM